jgi:hypothetical protein
MTILPKCPSCGLESPEPRCPRCNALKVIGCTGSCTLCKLSGGCEVPEPERPSAEVVDAEKAGRSAS